MYTYRTKDTHGFVFTCILILLYTPVCMHKYVGIVGLRVCADMKSAAVVALLAFRVHVTNCIGAYACTHVFRAISVCILYVCMCFSCIGLWIDLSLQSQALTYRYDVAESNITCAAVRAYFAGPIVRPTSLNMVQHIAPHPLLDRLLAQVSPGASSGTQE